VPDRQIFRSGPFSGKVIDAVTERPLEGAVVLVVWERDFATVGAGHSAQKFLDAEEVLTDQNGEFNVPARTHWAVYGMVPSPSITIYYPGYGAFPDFQVSPTIGARALPAGEYTTVELRRARTFDERRLFGGGIPTPGVVPKAKMPNLLRLLNDERRAMGLPPISTTEDK